MFPGSWEEVFVLGTVRIGSRTFLFVSLYPLPSFHRRAES